MPSDRRFFEYYLLEQQKKFAKMQEGILKHQLQEAIKKQQKQQQEFASALRYLMKLENETLIRKVRDPDPLVSFLAIQVAGKKRLPVEKECIGLLNSINPSLRQAARQTLIRLGRGVDFGPEPTAGPPQIALSVRGWSSWAAIQTEEPIEEPERQPPPVIAKEIPVKPEYQAIELAEPLAGRSVSAEAPVRVVAMARPPKITALPEVEWTEPVPEVELTPQPEESPGAGADSRVAPVHRSCRRRPFVGRCGFRRGAESRLVSLSRQPDANLSHGSRSCGGRTGVIALSFVLGFLQGLQSQTPDETRQLTPNLAVELAHARAQGSQTGCMVDPQHGGCRQAKRHEPALP